jgi:HD-GYP domain-containing protein (c-di-GMP phosphodiesterase class II)
MLTRGFIFFRGKVSRRIFLTVLLCSLVPIAALVFLTIHNVYTRSAENTAHRLRYVGKNVGMAIVSELTMIVNDLQLLASQQTVGQAETIEFSRLSGSDRLKAAWLSPLSGGGGEGLPEWTAEISQRLGSGLPHLSVEGTGHDTNLFIWVLVHDRQGHKGIGIGQLNTTYLWTLSQGFLPPNSYLTIADSEHNPLLHDSGDFAITLDLIQQTDRREGVYYTEIEQGGESLLVGSWDLYLKGAFSADSWRIYIAEPRSHAFAQIIQFQKNAGLTALLAFWVILLTVSILVRQILQPLTLLTSATQAIGQGDFGFELNVKSQDEFKAVADSINVMKGKVQRQILQQGQMGEAVRSILATVGRDEIILKFLEGLKFVVGAGTINLILSVKSAKSAAERWSWQRSTDDFPQRYPIAGLCPDEMSALAEETGQFIQATREQYPGLFQQLTHVETDSCLGFYININATDAAILTLADDSSVLNGEELVNVRLLADQLGVALSRNTMVRDLQDLNLGILTALARAVDANSGWTHGHSERVTEYALEIARELGLSDSQCESLQCAGLLHDLGKIAIPSEILDKRGKLTDEEYRRVQEHPAEAARIIEPIPPFKALLPIILQHHERWDGKGYPEGLQGENIHLGARILAVADVFDALYSDRPYRAGWSYEKVIAHIKDGTGTAFDPCVVDALMRIRPEPATT